MVNINYIWQTMKKLLLILLPFTGFAQSTDVSLNAGLSMVFPTRVSNKTAFAPHVDARITRITSNGLAFGITVGYTQMKSVYKKKTTDINFDPENPKNRHYYGQQSYNINANIGYSFGKKQILSAYATIGYFVNNNPSAGTWDKSDTGTTTYSVDNNGYSLGAAVNYIVPIGKKVGINMIANPKINFIKIKNNIPSIFGNFTSYNMFAIPLTAGVVVRL